MPSFLLVPVELCTSCRPTATRAPREARRKCPLCVLKGYRRREAIAGPAEIRSWQFVVAVVMTISGVEPRSAAVMSKRYGFLGAAWSAACRCPIGVGLRLRSVSAPASFRQLLLRPCPARSSLRKLSEPPLFLVLIAAPAGRVVGSAPDRRRVSSSSHLGDTRSSCFFASERCGGGPRSVVVVCLFRGGGDSCVQLVSSEAGGGAGGALLCRGHRHVRRSRSVGRGFRCGERRRMRPPSFRRRRRRRPRGSSFSALGIGRRGEKHRTSDEARRQHNEPRNRRTPHWFATQKSGLPTWQVRSV